MNDDENPNLHQSTQSATKSGAEQIKSFVREGIDFMAQTAAQAVDAVQEVSDKLTSGNLPRMEQAVGREAEVSTTIPVGGTGEVLFSLGGSLHHCAARGQDGRRSFKKGSKVKIVSTTNQLVFVE